jgi:hypothetical protein
VGYEEAEDPFLKIVTLDELPFPDTCAGREPQIESNARPEGLARIPVSNPRCAFLSSCTYARPG